MPSCTSPRVSASGLPISRVMRSARSSLRCVRRSPTRRRTSPRAGAGVRFQRAKPRTALATARSTSACPERGKRPIRSRVSAGLRFSKWAPVEGSTHCPSMKFWKVRMDDAKAGERPGAAVPRGIPQS